MTRGERIAAAARDAVGARFRPHGRDVEHGLDCVGLVALAVRAAGYAGAVPTGYALRGGDLADIERALAGGFRRVRSERVGDVIAASSAPGHLHLMIAVKGGFVHADATSKRVVERPGTPPWPAVGRWRATRRRAAWQLWS